MAMGPTGNEKSGGEKMIVNVNRILEMLMSVTVSLNSARLNIREWNLSIVTLNKRVSYMSIGFLVVELLTIDDENQFSVFEESSQALYPNSN
ncbi:10209_t:CDS:2, partial [Ambispora leptoticha]